MTEELKIRLSVDTSALKAGVESAKKSISGIGANGEGKKLTSDANQLNKSMNDFKGTLESIKRLSFADLLAGQFDKVSKVIKDVKWRAGESLGFFKTAFQQAFRIKTPHLDADDMGIANALESAKQGVEQLGKSLAGALGALGKVITSTAFLVGTLAISLTLLSINAFKTAKALKQISTEARSVGFAINDYQKWGYVLEQTGTEADKLRDFVRSLSSEQAQLREGNEDTIRTFEKLGLSAQQVANLNQQELFEATVDGLRRVENQVERTSIAYKIFGEDDASAIANLLNMENGQLEQTVRNFELLGGVASQNLIQSSAILQGEVQNLSVAWTGLKNALAEAVIPAVSAVVGWLVKAIAVVRMFISTLLGHKVATSTSAKSMKTATASVGGYRKAVDGARGAVEKLKRTTQSFDELNIVQNPNKGAGGSGGGGGGGTIGPVGGGGGGVDLGFPTAEDLGLEGIANWFDTYAEQIRTWTAIIAGILGGIALTVGIITGNIPLIVAGVGLLVSGIVALWPKIVEGAKACWNGIVGVFSSLAGWFNNNVIQPILNFIRPIVSWINTNIIQPILNVVGTIAGWVNTYVIQPIINFIRSILDAVIAILKAIYTNVKEIVSGIIEAIVSIVNKVVEIGSTIGQIFVALGKAAYDYIIKPIVDFVVNVASTVYSNAIKPVIDFFIELGQKAYAHIIKPIFDNIIWLKDKAISIFKTIGVTIADFIGGSIKGVINGVLNMIERTINRFIRMLNGAIGIINKIPGVNISAVSQLNIPRLATGGIATKSTIANIGEAGKEAVLPLENNTGWMDILAEKISGRQTAPSRIVLTVDGRELGWATIDNINAITKQTGGIPLAL